jgi:nucleotide-binding universal stress UspA family protein
MEPFKTIIVDIDATAAAQPAMARAVRLAEGCHAQLTITDVVTPEPYARQQLAVRSEDDLVSRRLALLARIAATVTAVPVEHKVLVGRAATMLIEEVERSPHPLLIRSHQAAVADDYPFGAVGNELLRKCPCPVLLVHPVSGDPPRLVAAAVNSSTHEPSEQALNARIASVARLVAHLEHAEVLLLQAWEPFAARVVRGRTSDESYAAYIEEMRQRTEGELRALARSAGEGPEMQTVLRRGKAEEVIDDFVRTRGVDLVVMGTVARAGLAGLLLGNTAKRVLRTLTCSVLAVKPLDS